jgi:hypothetical protein
MAMLDHARRESHWIDNPEGAFTTTITDLSVDYGTHPNRVRESLGALVGAGWLSVSPDVAVAGWDDDLSIRVNKYLSFNYPQGSDADRKAAERMRKSDEQRDAIFADSVVLQGSVTGCHESSAASLEERRGEERRGKRKSPNGDSSSSAKPNPDNRQKSNEPVGRNLNTEAREVFDHWRTTMRKRSNSVFSADRKSKVVARLREGYTVSQLKEAVTGYSMSAFHMGDNPDGKLWNDLELICRSGSKVEKGMELAVGGANHAASSRAPAAEMSKAEVHRAWLMREVGDVVEVDRLMREWEQQQGVAS